MARIISSFKHVSPVPTTETPVLDAVGGFMMRIGWERSKFGRRNQQLFVTHYQGWPLELLISGKQRAAIPTGQTAVTEMLVRDTEGGLLVEKPKNSSLLLPTTKTPALGAEGFFQPTILLSPAGKRNQ